MNIQTRIGVLKTTLSVMKELAWEARGEIAGAILGFLMSPLRARLPKPSSPSAIIRLMNNKNPIWKRAIHAPGVNSPIPNIKKPTIGDIVVQEHSASKLHWDVRIWVNGKDISFAVPKARFPTKDDVRGLLAVKQPDHVHAYYDFQGEIPKGQYGAGLVKTIHRGSVEVLESNNDKIKLVVLDGPLSGSYHLNRTKALDWLFQRQKPALLHVERQTFRMIGARKTPYLKQAKTAFEKGMVLEEKVDGSHEIIHWDDKGRVRLLSHRISKRTGNVIEHTHKLPQLRDQLQALGLRNTTLHGEVYHEMGPSFLAGILNSSLGRARLVQNEHGPVKIKFFSVNKIDGKDTTDIPYVSQYEYLCKHFSSLNNPIIGVVKQITPANVAEAQKFSIDVMAQKDVPCDGFVAKSPSIGYKQETWLKGKPFNTIDTPIVGFKEGSGKFQGSLGSIQVKVGDKEVTLGTGWSASEGKWIWEHRDSLVGEIVKSDFNDRTNSKITGGRFSGFHPDKSEVGLRMYAEAISPDPNTIYAIKKAAGWKK